MEQWDISERHLYTTYSYKMYIQHLKKFVYYKVNIVSFFKNQSYQEEASLIIVNLLLSMKRIKKLKK